MRKVEVTRSAWKWRRFFSSSLLALLVALVCTQGSTADDSVELPLPKYDDVILIPVTLGNADHLCVLDSGCTYHAFHTSLRDSLGTRLGEEVLEAADGEPVNAAFHSAPDIKIGPIALHGSRRSGQNSEAGSLALRSPRSVRKSLSLLTHTFDPLNDKDDDEECVVCSDLTVLQQMTGRNIQGFVGMQLFCAKVVQLDFDHRRIRILPAATTPSSDWGQPISVSFDNAELPTIDVELPDNINVTCIVDTGYSGTISISTELFRKLSDSHKISSKDDTLMWQATGIKTHHVGELVGAKIGGFESTGLRVTDGGTKNRIGLQYLRRFLVTFDLDRKQIYLKKGAKFDEPDKGPSVGIGLFRKNDMTFVGDVGRNSPGGRAGIHINDELISVGGEPVRGKPHAEIGWMFHEKADANGHLTLAMRRDGVERNVDVEINR